MAKDLNPDAIGKEESIEQLETAVFSWELKNSQFVSLAGGSGTSETYLKFQVWESQP